MIARSRVRACAAEPTPMLLARRGRALGVLVVALVAACGGEEGPPVAELAVRFEAHADDRALAGVQILRDGELVGITAPDGTLAATLTGREGDSVRLTARCPEGHRNPDNLPPLLLRRISDTTGQGARALTIDVPCRPELRDGVVVVRSQGYGGLPVLIDGAEVARTDDNGVAHVAVRMAPHATFSVQLATAHVPSLRPQAPSRSFTVPDSNEIFVFDQDLELEQAEPARVRRRHRRRRGPRPIRHIPVRLGGRR